ncbi:hypothetical protein LCGC14_0931260 [marine sediment metagenome]|uniref:Uncharacterized protein n=1 Tax=marine sediment metagenome TaxID=412755 RepID=A0A0F9NSI3_9ZZZZ
MEEGRRRPKGWANPYADYKRIAEELPTRNGWDEAMFHAYEDGADAYSLLAEEEEW